MGMVDTIRISLCQIGPVVGDVSANVDAILEAHRRSVEGGARISVFPQLALCGMVPRDLLLRKDFLAECERGLERLRRELDPDALAIVGAPVIGEAGLLHDGLVGFEDGRSEVIATKVHLGNRGPQEDLRYFTPGTPGRIEVDGVDVLLAVGDELVETVSNADPVSEPSAARIVIDPIASPYVVGGPELRRRDLVRAASRFGAPVVMVNGVGGNDELVFDGGAMVVDASGRTIVDPIRFVERVEVVEVPLPAGPVPSDPVGFSDRPTPLDVAAVRGEAPPVDWSDVDWGEVWSALVMGIADYVDANGFPAVGLGLSGGVDSALVATLAAEAVGAERVHCVLMPSRYSSEGSVTDATELAVNLGVDHRVIPIEEAHAAFASMLEPSLGGECRGTTDENLQARVRGTTLMALSNEFGWLILVGSNRSEALVGYSTLYGDSAGGLAPISDVYKLGVYELCRWYNDRCTRTGSTALIPEVILTKAPSAELRPDQRDDESLPPYEILDPLLRGYVDQRLSPSELVGSGFEPEIVERIVGLVDRSEYKRRQAPPGIMITDRGPSSRRDMPLTSR